MSTTLHRSFIPIPNKCIPCIILSGSVFIFISFFFPHSWSKRYERSLYVLTPKFHIGGAKKKQVKIIYKWLMIKSNKNTIDRHSSSLEKFWAETDLNILNSTQNAHFIPFRAPCASARLSSFFRQFIFLFLSSQWAHTSYLKKTKLVVAFHYSSGKKTPNSRQQQSGRTDRVRLRHSATPCGTKEN